MHEKVRGILTRRMAAGSALALLAKKLAEQLSSFTKTLCIICTGSKDLLYYVLYVLYYIIY